MQPASLMNRVPDMYAFVVQALTATAFTANPVSLGATSLITAIAMLNAFTIPNPLATDANAKRSFISFF